MTYQILSQVRTGSHYLYTYTKTDIHIGEYFLPNLRLTKLGVTDEEMWSWLKNEKSIGNHHSIIVNMKNRFVENDPNFIDKLIRHFRGYHILTIKRKPWDIFISRSYALQTNIYERVVGEEIIIPDDFKIEVDDVAVMNFINNYKISTGFINTILEEQVHTILQYEDINETYLNKFFGVDTPYSDIEPMNIDYEKYIEDVSYWKKYFENKLDE
jgi:hypothetical protein